MLMSARLLRELLLWLHLTKGSEFLMGNPTEIENQKPQQKHKELITKSALGEKKKTKNQPKLKEDSEVKYEQIILIHLHV